MQLTTLQYQMVFILSGFISLYTIGFLFFFGGGVL